MILNRKGVYFWGLEAYKILAGGGAAGASMGFHSTPAQTMGAEAAAKEPVPGKAGHQPEPKRGEHIP